MPTHKRPLMVSLSNHHPNPVEGPRSTDSTARFFANRIPCLESPLSATNSKSQSNPRPTCAHIRFPANAWPTPAPTASTTGVGATRVVARPQGRGIGVLDPQEPPRGGVPPTGAWGPQAPREKPPRAGGWAHPRSQYRTKPPSEGWGMQPPMPAGCFAHPSSGLSPYLRFPAGCPHLVSRPIRLLSATGDSNPPPRHNPKLHPNSKGHSIDATPSCAQPQRDTKPPFNLKAAPGLSDRRNGVPRHGGSGEKRVTQFKAIQTAGAA